MGSRRHLLAVAAIACLGIIFLALVAGGGQTPLESQDQQLHSAFELYRSGRLVQAEEQLRRILQLSPSNFEATELMGMVLANEKKNQQASQFLRTAARLRPMSAPTRTNLAVVLVRLGEMTQAEEQFRKAAEIEPGIFETNHNLGEFYIREGKLASAIVYLAKAQRADPGSYVNGYDLALAYEKTGRLTEAREQIHLLLTRRNTADLHDLLADVEEKTGNYVAAANEYETAAHMDPSEGNLLDWGLELLLHHTLDPAVEVFRRGLQLYPRSTRLAIGLSVALYWKGFYHQAVQVLLEAAQKNPPAARLYTFLNMIYHESPADLDAVTKCFRQYTELEPRNSRAYYYYAVSLWTRERVQNFNRDLSEIEALLEKSQTLDPSFADTYFQLGKAYSEQHEFAKAIPELRQAIHLAPNQAEAHYLLGQAYVRTAREGLARREFHVYQRMHEEHASKNEKQQAKIQVFVVNMKKSASGKP